MSFLDGRLESLIVLNLSNVELGLETFPRIFESFAPIVAVGVGKELPSFVEVGSGHWTGPCLRALKLALIILVPKEVAAILSVACKSVESFVKGETVD